MLDLLSLVVQGLFTLCFAAVGSYFMWRLIGPAVVTNAIRAKMGPILMEWLTTPAYKTGGKRRVTDEESGETVETDEVLSPLEMIIKNAGDVLYSKMMGKLGGDVRKRQAVQSDIVAGLANPASPFAGFLNSVNPALLNRALKDGDYVPIILDQLGPTLVKYAEGHLNKSKGDATTGGNSTSW